jgi:glycosyltransferase involved in cell wall biosynthesis
VIGKAGVYFDPLSASDFAAGLEEIDNETKLRELSAFARPQSEKFNWRRMAEPVLEWLTHT